MKKLFLSFAIVTMSVALFAQLQISTKQFGNDLVSSKKDVPAFFSAKSPTDTLGWSLTSIPCFGSPTMAFNLYGMTATSGTVSGYWFGTNWDTSDTTGTDWWSMGYVVSAPLGIEGIIIGVGKKAVITGGAGSYIELSIYNIAADNAMIAASTKGVGPDVYSGSPLSSVQILASAIDTAWANLGMNYVALPSVVPMSADFAVVANFNAMRVTGDTAAMMCDEPGNHGGLNYSWSNGDPYTYYWNTLSYGSSGALDVNMTLFAVIDANYVGINDEGYFQGMRLTTSPNPASDMLTLEFALQNDGNVKAQIISLNGQVVKEESFGHQSASNYNKQVINISDLSAGTYFVSLMSNGNRLTKKFIVE